MHQLQFAQERTDKLIIAIDPQLIEPKRHVRGNIFVKETQRAERQRQKHRAFDEFENCDGEQGSAAVSTPFRLSSSSRHIKSQIRQSRLIID